MIGKICICPKTMAWIFRNLKKASKAKFRTMMKRQAKGEMKPRSAKQIRATKKLIAFNKRRRARR